MECSGSSNIQADTAICPGCGISGKTVKVRTLKHWLKAPLVSVIPDIPFRFCETSDCPVVYFSENGSIRYAKDELRGPVGIKEDDPSIPVCYCFGVTPEMISKEIRDKGRSTFSTWVAKETKQGNCACDVRNPKGKCCLEDVKNVEKGVT